MGSTFGSFNLQEKRRHLLWIGRSIKGLAALHDIPPRAGRRNSAGRPQLLAVDFTLLDGQSAIKRSRAFALFHEIRSATTGGRDADSSARRLSSTLRAQTEIVCIFVLSALYCQSQDQPRTKYKNQTMTRGKEVLPIDRRKQSRNQTFSRVVRPQSRFVPAGVFPAAFSKRRSTQLRSAQNLKFLSVFASNLQFSGPCFGSKEMLGIEDIGPSPATHSTEQLAVFGKRLLTLARSRRIVWKIFAGAQSQASHARYARCRRRESGPGRVLHENSFLVLTPQQSSVAAFAYIST